MNNERMPQNVETTRMQGIMKRDRPCKRWSEEVAENFKAMEIRNWHTLARDQEE
jgi:hypothetical protein